MENNLKQLISIIEALPLDEKIEAINNVKAALHNISPFKNEPVDCVIWIKNDLVVSNDYNPNVVASTEMELLTLSIENDGYTQPIVSFKNDENYEVVDGFHRHKVGKNNDNILKKVCSYLPVVVINNERTDKTDRIASTIRHNRARGKHKIESMSEIVLELSRRNWNDKKIAKELGMDSDEVLRLKQISGLADAFSNSEFSTAWEI